MNRNISQQYVRDILNYDSATGIFTWKKPKSKRVRVGEVAGCYDRDKYIIIRIDRIGYPAHQLAMLYVYGSLGEYCVDHINGVKYDNRIDNLRYASFSENQYNTKLRKTNKTGVKGVYAHKNKFRAQIKYSGTRKHLGTFNTIELAYKAYCEASKLYHKEFTPIEIQSYGQ